MKPLWAALLFALLAGAGCLNACAASVRALYPQSTEITRYRTVSNGVMTCDWNFDCRRGMPLFHMHSQDDLRRTGGWARTGLWVKGARSMIFVLYASTYQHAPDPSTPSIAAWTDFQNAVAARGFVVRQAPRVLPLSMPGDTIEAAFRSGTTYDVVVAGYTGDREIEGVVITENLGAKGRAMVARDLRAQATDAFNRARP